MTDDPADFTADIEKDRNFVTALARGLDVLRAFKPGETALTNTDLAERTGLPKPTVSRLTYTLCQLDYLSSDAQSGGYRLGAGVLQLGYGALAGMEIVARATGVLRDLASGPNSFISCALAERHRLQAVYIAAAPSVESISLHLTVGARLPLFQSSIGRAILAVTETETREQLLDRAKSSDPDGHALRQDWIATAIDQYHKQGFVTGYGDWRSDVNAIAVPVRALDRSRVWGLNAGGPSFHVSPEVLERDYSQRLIDAARALGPNSRDSL